MWDSTGCEINYMAMKHARTIHKIDLTHQKLEQFLENNFKDEADQLDCQVNGAVTDRNTTYHQSITCIFTEEF